jgi:hypothetical protein
VTGATLSVAAMIATALIRYCESSRDSALVEVVVGV